MKGGVWCKKHILTDKHGYYIFANTEYAFLTIPTWWKYCPICGKPRPKGSENERKGVV